MLRTIGRALGTAHAAVFLVVGLFHVWFWARRGFGAPRYIHLMALASVIVAVGVVYAQPDTAAKPDHGIRDYLSLALIFPALVYGAFVFYGGAATMDDDRGR